MNFARDVVEAAPARSRALVELARDGGRREWSFGEVAEAARNLAARLHGEGLERGDVVLTLVGNRPEWVVAMVACFRQGYVVLPCTEQLRAKDLALRLAVSDPRLVVADERNAAVLDDAGWSGPTVWVPFEDAPATAPPAAADLEPDDPA
jgi:acyl-coenzyme A synthetase/AMP-(fatty) acid ligase